MDSKIKTAVIGAVAVVFAAILAGIVGPILVEQFKGGKKSPTLVPTAQLEQELSKANIYLSDVNPDKIRNWLRSDPAYYALAQNCLVVMSGKKVNDLVPLDVINGKYKELFGYAPNQYLRPDKYNDLDKLKIAILKAWQDKNAGFPQTSFDQIVEDIPKPQ